MKYGHVHKWRPGLLHQVPDAFPSLPVQDIGPPDYIQTNVPDYVGTKPPTYMRSKGPAYDGESPINRRYPAGVGEEDSNIIALIKALIVDRTEIKAAAFAKSRFDATTLCPPGAKNFPSAEMAEIDSSGPVRRLNRLCGEL